MEYEEIDGAPGSQLEDGSQIARKGLFKDLNSTLATMYARIIGSPHYYHHGIYMGDNKVVHFIGETKSDARPREIDLQEFIDNGVNGSLLLVKHTKLKPLPLQETIQRAEKLVHGNVQWPEYDIVENNCETMATYLKTGVAHSTQVQNALDYSLGIAGIVAAGSSLASGR